MAQEVPRFRSWVEDLHREIADSYAACESMKILRLGSKAHYESDNIEEGVE